MLVNYKLLQQFTNQTNSEFYTYSIENENANFYARNLRIKNSVYVFDLVYKNNEIKDIELKMPGLINVENAVAALSSVILFGADISNIQNSLKDFEGIKRRFEYIIKSKEFIFIDDYAHHPEEIKATLSSVKALYPGKKTHVIFQPHLYSRTKDFAKEFANALDVADRVLLLDIYPAREEPIPGVSSELILKHMKNDNAVLCKEDDILNLVKNDKPDILLTMGAGDIDRLVPVLEKNLK